jgi:CheY-like chemotaxis protein
MSDEGFSILYAEDDPEDRQIFLEAARQANAKIAIKEAADGQQLLRYLSELSGEADLPHAIVSDLRMPLIDGLEVLDEVKNNASWKQIPFVLFSTSTNHQDINRALELGAAAYFSKPDSYEEVLRMVRRIIAVCENSHTEV